MEEFKNKLKGVRETQEQGAQLFVERYFLNSEDHSFNFLYFEKNFKISQFFASVSL